MYSRALALVANGKEAEKERELFVAEVGAFPPDANFGEMNKARDVLGVAVHVVDGRLRRPRATRTQPLNIGLRPWLFRNR